jgi:signal transduction histidine kinase
MRKLIESVLESIKPIRKSREIILEASEEEIVTNIDGKRITQVLTNLLTNAIKYTPKDKKIIVRLINLPKSIRVEVQDFGEGIHPEKKVRIFEKFFQIDRGTPNTQGMGLGLFISKAIIETHKGKIGVKSKLGEGSTFYFQLPK